MYIWQHFRTITHHKLLVMRYCFRIGLYCQGLAHDLSKYSFTFFSSPLTARITYQFLTCSAMLFVECTLPRRKTGSPGAAKLKMTGGINPE